MASLNSSSYVLTVVHMRPTYAVTAWAIMQGFEGAKVQNELNGRKIHQLANIITMNGDYRTFFDDLQVWLEPAVHFLHC
jgi:hypothetical protein